MAERNVTIDIAKGIGITLMVVGHTYCPTILCNFIYLFHMPLFFFISGYLSFKLVGNDNNATTIINKIKRLYIPYFSFSLVLLILHNLLYRIHLEPVEYNLNNILIKTIELPFMLGTDPLIAGYWFLGCLSYIILFVSLLNVLLGKLENKTKVVIMALLTVFVFEIVFVIRKWSFVHTEPYNFITCNLITVLSSSFFFIAGTFAKIWRFNIYLRPVWILLGCLFLLVVSYFHPIYRPYDMVDYSILVFITGIVGTLCTLSISKSICGIMAKILSFLGQHTLFILSWHLLCFKILPFAKILMDGGRTYDLLEEYPVPLSLCADGGWILFSVIGVMVPVISLLIYRRLNYNRVNAI